MKRHAKFGYYLGSIAAIFVLLVYAIPGREAWHNAGPATPGHEPLDCAACHVEAPGTARQQLQANARAALGERSSYVAFGFEKVTNDTCKSCHDRPNDNHPVFRFTESRFVEARRAVAPHLCVSCHLEHEGQRVTIGLDFCSHCHADLELPDDPVDVPHTQLVAQENWNSCLGCHDFHGNHEREAQTMVAEAFDTSVIEAYFEKGPSPYGERIHEATEKTDE